MVRLKDWGIAYEADSLHRKLVQEHFRFDGITTGLSANGTAERCGQKDNDASCLPRKPRASSRLKAVQTSSSQSRRFAKRCHVPARDRRKAEKTGEVLGGPAESSRGVSPARSGG